MLMIQLEPGTQGTAEKQQGVNIHSRQHPRLVRITVGEARNRPVMAKIIGCPDSHEEDMKNK